jgi:hypothetical protein
MTDLQFLIFFPLYILFWLVVILKIDQIVTILP